MSNTQPIRILYIEDDVVTAAYVQTQLQQCGYLVELAQDGFDGLRKIKSSSYDVIAVDYHLPGMNGLQVLQNLAESQFQVPAIMITGAGNEQVAVEAMKLGAGDYLIKDIDSHFLELLPAAIESELEKQQLIAEKQQAVDALYYHDIILEAVSFAAQNFLTCSHWAEPIQEVLAHLGQAVSASRIYIFENHRQPNLSNGITKELSPSSIGAEWGDLLTSQRFEWVANGIAPQIDNPQLQNLHYEPALRRWVKILSKGEPLYGLVKEFPQPEAEILVAQGIFSIAVVPVFVGKKWWGFIGYDDCLTERVWSPMVIEAFKTAAHILGAAIGHDLMNQALRDSEARLAKTQSMAHLGHCEWDIIANTKQLSAETLNIFGWPSDSNPVSHDKFIQAIHPDDRSAAQKAALQTIHYNIPYDIEFRIIRPDGTNRYLHNVAELVRNANGKAVRFIATAQDITEYKTVEKALRESTQTLSAILNAATDSIVMIELDTTCVMINPAGAARLGRSVDEVIGRPLCQLVAAEVVNHRQTVVDWVIRTKQPTRFDDQESKNLWFEHSIYPVVDESGSVIRVAVVSRDITERKGSEEALRRERDFTNAIISAAGSLIVVLDRKGRIVRFNKTCEELTGYTFEQVKSHQIWEFFLLAKDIESCKTYFNNLVAMKNSPQRYENYWVTKNNMLRLIDWSHAVISDKSGVEYVIGIGIDITERKKAEEALASTLAEQKVILDHSLVGIAFITEKRQFVRANRKLEEMCGYTEAELKNNTTEILYYSSKEYQNIGSQSYPLIRKGMTYEMEHLMRRKNGTPFWCRVKIKVIDPNDFTKGYIWNLEDVTEQRRAEENLRLAETVFETTTEGIIITDANNRIIRVNPALTTITGYTLDEVVGKTPNIFKSCRHNTDFFKAIWKTLIETGRWQGEIWNQRKNGEDYVVWMSIAAIREPSGRIVQYVAVFSDITERKQAEEFIWHQAHYDSLTNLPNRTLFADRLADAVQTAKCHQENQPNQPNQKRLAVMFIDLDHFKSVNDTLGHKAGDMLLKIAAQRLSRCVRESDTVARLGGDEFTVILSQIDEILDIKAIAERIINTLSQPFRLNNHEASIAASIGIALFPENGADAETLLKNADIAMYQAKENGRNAYRFFTTVT